MPLRVAIRLSCAAALILVAACGPRLKPITAPVAVPTALLPDVPASAVTLAVSYDVDQLRREALADLPNPLAAGEDRMNLKAKVSIFTPVEVTETIYETVYDKTIRKVTGPCSKIPLLGLVCKLIDEVVTVPRKITKLVKKIVNVETTVTTPIDAVVRHRVEMENLDIRFDGDRYRAAVDLRFSVKTSVDAKIATVGVVSCGVGEPMAKLHLVQTGRLALSGDEKVIISRDPWSRDIDSCNLTAFDIPVEKVLGWLPGLNKQLDGIIDKQIEKLPAEVALAPHLNDAWRELSRPIGITPDSGAWMVIAPESLYAEPPTGHGTVLSVTASVVSHPVAVLGKKPKTVVAPRPTLKVKQLDPGFTVYLQGDVGYDQAGDVLTKAVKGREFRLAIAKFEATGVHVYGSDTSVVVAVDIKKPARGRLYLTGTPVYDTITNTISLANLDFTAQTRNVIVNTAIWVLEGLIRRELTKAAVFSLDKNLAEARRAFAHRTVPLGDAGTLTVDVTSVKPIGVFPRREGMSALLFLQGAATVTPTAPATTAAAATESPSPDE